MYVLYGMYVSVYACMHAYMHSCMYVCMYVCMYMQKRGKRVPTNKRDSDPCIGELLGKGMLDIRRHLGKWVNRKVGCVVVHVEMGHMQLEGDMDFRCWGVRKGGGKAS